MYQEMIAIVVTGSLSLYHFGVEFPWSNYIDLPQISRNCIKGMCVGNCFLLLCAFTFQPFVLFCHYFKLKAIIQVFQLCCTIEHVSALLPEVGSSQPAIYDLFASHVLVTLVYQDFEESIYSWLLKYLLSFSCNYVDLITNLKVKIGAS